MKFDVYRVYKTDGNAIDLTQQDDWKTASDVKLTDLFTGPIADRKVNGERAKDIKVLETSDQGTVTSDALPAGLYLVVEQKNQKVGTDLIVPAQPFLVTLPTTNPEGNGWLDDVHVYPKNQVTPTDSNKLGDPDDPSDTTSPLKAKKTISDPEKTTGDVDLTGTNLNEKIRYTIDAVSQIELAEDNFLDGFVISDKMPKELTNPTVEVYVSNPDGTDRVKLETDGNTTTPGYTVKTEKVGENYIVTVKFNREEKATTADGPKKLLRNKKLALQIDATLSEIPTGAISNQGYVYPGNVDTPDGFDPIAPDSPMIPVGGDEPVKSLYGTLNITKEDAANEVTKLKDAEFQLFRCTADGNNLKTTGSPLRFGDNLTFKTGDTGEVSIPGIHLGDVKTFRDSGTGTWSTDLVNIWDGKGTTFCAVETKAPKGYAPAPQPFEVKLAADKDTTALQTFPLIAKNTKANAGFTLPLTGGMGLWLLLGLGLAAIVAALINRARKTA